MSRPASDSQYRFDRHHHHHRRRRHHHHYCELRRWHAWVSAAAAAAAAAALVFGQPLPLQFVILGVRPLLGRCARASGALRQ